MEKSLQKNFWNKFVVAWRRGGAFCKAGLVRLPGGGVTFLHRKVPPPPEAEKGNRGADMGEKGGKLNKKACCISMLGGRVRLAICPERLYNYNVVICNAHKEAQTRPNKQEGGMEHGTKPQQ